MINLYSKFLIMRYYMELLFLLTACSTRSPAMMPAFGLMSRDLIFK